MRGGLLIGSSGLDHWWHTDPYMVWRLPKHDKSPANASLREFLLPAEVSLHHELISLVKMH